MCAFEQDAVYRQHNDLPTAFVNTLFRLDYLDVFRAVDRELIYPDWILFLLLNTNCVITF